MNPVWLFDLDNTLHDANRHIFPQINRAMTRYLADTLSLNEADACALREHYWQRYGATLHGMMRHHGTRASDFLAATHHFEDLRALLVFDPVLRHCLPRLPGRKYVFSNSTRSYVDQVLRLTGLDRLIDGSFAIEDLALQPKPRLQAYRAVLRRLGVPAQRCIMVEDSLENLRPAHRLGMHTVWIAPPANVPPWVDQRLRSVRELRGAPRRFQASTRAIATA